MYLNLLCFYALENYYLNKFPHHSCHVQEDALLLNYNRMLWKKQSTLRPGRQGRMFSCTNKIEASLPFSSINPKLLDTYHVLEIHSLSRWSDLDWILRPWPSVLLLQEKPVSVDSKNVLENIYIHGNECRVPTCTMEDPPSHTWVYRTLS